MKRLFIVALVATLLTSCGYRDKQVMYTDGKVAWVRNDISLDVKKGDTVIVQYYLPTTNQYMYGKYLGKLPDNFFDSTGGIIYDKAVILK